MCVFPPSLRLLTLVPGAPGPASFNDSYLADVIPWLSLLKRILLIETALRNCLLDQPYTIAFRIPCKGEVSACRNISSIFCNLIGQSMLSKSHVVFTYKDHTLGTKVVDCNFNHIARDTSFVVNNAYLLTCFQWDLCFQKPSGP